MVIKRQAYKLVILEPAKTRIAQNKCPSCGKPKSKWDRRTDWTCCSTKCTEKYHDLYEIIGQGDFRSKILKRDKYTCQKCGKKPLLEFPSGKLTDWPDKSQLIVDHIKPIAIGGDQWDLNNVQTLCLQCNKIKTKKDAGDIAKDRRINRKLVDGQQKLFI